jgi:long-chain fatty acid transport protein
VINGDGFGFGYTLGLLWRPSNGTSVGAGFRSSVEHTLDGETLVAGVEALGRAKVSADLEMPAIATLSIRQRVGSRITILGTMEWTDWSDLQQVNPSVTQIRRRLTALPFHWHDNREQHQYQNDRRQHRPSPSALSSLFVRNQWIMVMTRIARRLAYV